ncbi:head GIN domain-containing protein [Massilia pseudoviolaceinigra]|uniref:head GIN domain-containing protein n=1 Tax=Massilia pseudoviolaceinigra TaxID=3057165 RepID=UPI0027969525|nr:head GIN domain-containing protein [Massilia sp. CCM 9206]MDQ1922009.1 head GIN domain-containing protein [Massilia sp. CCM 9206]
MRSLIKVGFGLLLLAFVLIALFYGMLRAQGTTRPANPEGRVVASEARHVGNDVTSVVLGGPIDMTLRQGAVASLTVRGEQRLLGNIGTVSEGNTLHIETKGMLLHHKQPLQVVLVLPSIDSVRIHGSGDSTINGFSGDKIALQLHGSGDVKFNGRYRAVEAGLQGSGDIELNGGNSDKVDVSVVGSGSMTVVGAAKQFKVAQTGSGDLDAEHLSADTVAVELMGSGSAVVQARKSATVNLRGSGDVNVHGNPDERNVTRNGSGDVTFE